MSDKDWTPYLRDFILETKSTLCGNKHYRDLYCILD